MSDDTFFGDSDPEDAWDDGDPTDDKLRILDRVIDALKDCEHDDRWDFRRRDALRLVGKLENADGVKRGERRRLARIREALEGLD